MAKIFTSYFCKVDMLISCNIVPLRISIGKPKDYTGLYYLALAPTWEMLNDTKTYNEKYNEILSKLNPQKVYDELISLGNGKDVAILCFEKDINKCHRKVVAEWLEKEINIEITEF